MDLRRLRQESLAGNLGRVGAWRIGTMSTYARSAKAMRPTMFRASSASHSARLSTVSTETRRWRLNGGLGRPAWGIARY
jgi:hypothetical protein